MVGQVLDGGFHAVAAGLTGDPDGVERIQPGQQAAVEPGGGIVGIGHLGLQGAVVLGPGVVALGHLQHLAQAAVFPLVVGGAHGAVDVVAPAADFAMHRPHHQAVAALGLQRIQVGQHAEQHGGIGGGLPGHTGLHRTLPFGPFPALHHGCWHKRSGPHLRGGDGGEWGHRRAIARAPERGVGNVHAVVRVEGDDDVIQPCAAALDEIGHAPHVGIGPGHRQRWRTQGRGGQVAEIVLGVDEQQHRARRSGARSGRDSCGRAHGRTPLLSCTVQLIWVV